jgi:hypothetical protein
VALREAGVAIGSASQNLFEYRDCAADVGEPVVER